MPIKVQCPGCGENLRGKDELAGRRVKCPKCGRQFRLGLQLEPSPASKRGKAATSTSARPVEEAAASQPAASTSDMTMRLDIQNFGRCCADIARANIKFDTQLIKDVGDGPFRAGKYEEAFRKFEQFAIGFNSAVANSRRAIAEARRALMAEKGRLSGKEIEERKAAFIRHEQLIHAAERSFSTILEGLRTYLRAQQG